jgi:hypothetical protein
VVHGWACLVLAIACDGSDVWHTGVASLIVDVAIIADRSCGLLIALLMPLLAALPSIVDDDVG